MEKILVNTDEFNGCYVAIKSFDDNTIWEIKDFQYALYWDY